MIQNDSYYKRLVLGFINNSISIEQVKELYEFIAREPEKYSVLMDEPEVLLLIKQQMDNTSLTISSGADDRFQERIKQAVEFARVDADNKKPPPVDRIHFLRTAWFRYTAAAVLIIALVTTAVVVSSDRQSVKSSIDLSKTSPQTDALPGKNGAILTLADGSKVLLDSLGNGVVTTQGKTTVLIKNGRLVYDATVKSNEVLYNTMTTPKGRQYQLILPDGSKVWLNAASSITYPTVFAGNDRTVTIGGEAYFEVAKDKTQPFHVKVNDMDVQVLGTHFNINSYADEAAIKTTLLEGKVRVTRGEWPVSGGNSGTNSKQEVVLKPGEQAVLTTHSSLTTNHSPDLDQVMAWKNGRFQFDRTPLPVVMRQLSRWYDVDVEYATNTPDVVFAGEVGRDLTLSQVLHGFSKMGVTFKIEGKKLIVMP